MKDINVSERLEALMSRREKRNPGLAKVRTYKFGKKSALLWDHMIMPTKREATENWL